MANILLLVLLLTGPVIALEYDYCYSEDEDPYLYFGTKTAYHFVGHKTYNLNDQIVPGCKPVQIWSLLRHGTRYASKKVLKEFNTLPELRDQILKNREERHNSRLCDKDLENLRNWQVIAEATVDKAENLTPQGVEDMQLLALRLRSSFPGLLNPDEAHLTSGNYKFRASDTERTRTSLETFMQSLFGRKEAVSYELSSSNDTLLVAYKACTSWNQDMTNNEAQILTEVTKFKNSTEYQNLVHNVSQRLGYLYDLSSDTIELMYEACRYEKAWFVKRLSPWCAVFSKKELQVLEYLEDLEQYYINGYGREVNAQLGCMLLKDLFQHFWKLEGQDYDDEPKATFYFAHSKSLSTFLAAMGIAKDSTPLTADNYPLMTKRQWRTSLIGPFASNFAAVFYKCDNSTAPNKVMFYLEEKPVQYPGCEVGLCDWDYLKRKLGSTAVNCNLDFCWSDSGVSSINPMNNILLMLTVVITSLVFSQN